jgi:hypothetical protein
VPWKKAQNPKFFPLFGFIEKRKERLFFGGTHAKNFSVHLREKRRWRHLNGPYLLFLNIFLLLNGTMVLD